MIKFLLWTPEEILWHSEPLVTLAGNWTQKRRKTRLWSNFEPTIGMDKSGKFHDLVVAESGQVPI